MKIFVMRHGETVWNSKGITQGISQNRLSKKGKDQAEMTASVAKNLNIDLILVSPLMRTVQTANIMNKFHNAKIVKNNKIIECDQGIFTGRKYMSLTFEEKLIKAKRQKEQGMEAIEEIEQRVKEFIAEIKENYNNKNILVVTHNIIASAIESLARFGKFDDEIFRNQVKFDNAELKEIEI